jgi:hypothetical protein
MRKVPALLVLLLAGCATGDLSRNEPPPVAGPVGPQIAAPSGPPSLSSPAARAAAAPDATVSSSGLLACERQSCKINCSAKVPARARPKWCGQFEAPVE